LEDDGEKLQRQTAAVLVPTVHSLLAPLLLLSTNRRVAFARAPEVEIQIGEPPVGAAS
jgi:hypothetical protein